MPTKYQLLAIDVDGTLIAPDQRIRPEVVSAIEKAQAAGVRVCLATGRSYVETLPVWRQLSLMDSPEPMILIGGALVAEPTTGRTLYSRTIKQSLAGRYADALNRMGYSALAIVDAWQWGVDYYLAGSADAETVTRDWFSKMDVEIRHVDSFSDAADMPQSLRINAIVSQDSARAVADELKGQFDGQLNMHAIVAPNYGVTIVEAFAADVNKAAALTHVAEAHRIPAANIVAVGDDINDAPMLKSAGLGVAMPGGSDSAKEAADIVAADGLASFISDMLQGFFDEVDKVDHVD